MVKGVVSGVQQRYEPAWGMLVWTFRIERAGPDGSPLPRVAVEMRGRSIGGSVANGDWVEIATRTPWQSGMTLKPKTVKNLSSNSVVEANTSNRSVPLYIFGALVAAGVLAVFTLIVMEAFK